MSILKLATTICMATSLLSFTLPSVQKPIMSTISKSNESQVTWKQETITLGEIPQNKPASITFEFTNSSDADVIVTNATASCGCTVADYPKQPIGAGKSAVISATFNAAAMGAFSKTITVTFQNGESKTLNFSGTVI